MTDYQFKVLVDGELVDQSIEVFAYPMGDVTVRQIPGTELIGKTAPTQVIVVRGAAVDWSIVAAWADFVRAKFSVERFPSWSPKTVAFVPYLPSARGDKDSPAPARINARLAAAADIDVLITADPHSDVWIEEYAEYSHSTTVANVVDVSAVTANAVALKVYDGIIAPDKGAVGRAKAVAQRLNLPLFTATKHRDPDTGKLSGYKLSDGINLNGAYLVVDDICDGGGTFVLLTQAVPDTVTLDLWVTHGGFTKGLHNGLERYRGIFTTNSLPNVTKISNEVNVSDLEPYLIPKLIKINKSYVKQLNESMVKK